MNFRNPKVDQPIFAELSDQQVFSQQEWNSWSLPDEGDLTEVIASNAPRVRAAAWLSWLVKRHNLLRVANPEPDRSLLSQLGATPEFRQATRFFGLFPFELRGKTLNLVSLRPDVHETASALAKIYGADRFHLFALTPVELTFWRQCNEVL